MEPYRIADEPKPSPLSRLAVNPIWPLFGIMFAGAWLSWPWYILNGKALGSPTFRRECVIAAIGFGGALLLTSFLLYLDGLGLVTKQMVPYTLLALTTWKLGISYWLQVVQSRTFGIYTYYGGVVRNGIVVIVLASIFGRPFVMNAAGFSTALQLVLS